MIGCRGEASVQLAANLREGGQPAPKSRFRRRFAETITRLDDPRPLSCSSPMDDEENPKEEDVEIIAVSTPELVVTKRPSHISHHRPSFFSPQIEELRRRREELRRKSPEVAESDRLLHEITRLERESRAGDRRPSKNLEKAISETSSSDLEKIHSKLRTKFFSRPKIRAYFHRERLYKSITADNEDVATSCLSLFTDLLFVGVLAETGQLAVLGDGGSISLVRFIVQFLPSWRIWCYIRDIVAIYEMNAISQRSLILWVLSLLVGFVTKYGSFL